MLKTLGRVMIRDHILLPYIDTMVSKSMQKIDRLGNTLIRMFLMARQYVQNWIMKDTYRLQRELKQRNIKVMADEQEDFLVCYKIFFHIYQERFGMTQDVMRTEISLWLTQYTSNLGDVLNNSLK